MNTLTDRILEKLAGGPAYYETLRTVGGDRREFQRALRELRDIGRVDLTGCGYEITTTGLGRLAELNQLASTVDPCRKGPERNSAEVCRAVPTDAGEHSSARPRQGMPASTAIAPAESVYGLRAQA